MDRDVAIDQLTEVHETEDRSATSLLYDNPKQFRAVRSLLLLSSAMGVGGEWFWCTCQDPPCGNVILDWDMVVGMAVDRQGRVWTVKGMALIDVMEHLEDDEE